MQMWKNLQDEVSVRRVQAVKKKGKAIR